jgi:glucosamine kinase
MTDLNSRFLIGVDGGGTSCRVALLRDGQRFETKLGRANVASDRAGAIATIRQGIDDVLAKAGLLPADLAKSDIYMGLAGVMSDADSTDVANAFATRKIAIFDDRELAMWAGLGDADGAIVSIGTGSFIGRRSKEAVRYVGGWGLALDDAASGAWLGRASFRETLRACDGFHAHTALTALIMSDFDNSPADIVNFSLTASPAEFASYAPRVFDMAAEKDAVAVELIRAGADYICRSLDVLGWQSAEPLGLLGGLGPQYSCYLPEAVAGSVVEPNGSNLDAALTLAALLGSTRHPSRQR